MLQDVSYFLSYSASWTYLPWPESFVPTQVDTARREQPVLSLLSSHRLEESLGAD